MGQSPPGLVSLRSSPCRSFGVRQSHTRYARSLRLCAGTICNWRMRRDGISHPGLLERRGQCLDPLMSLEYPTPSLEDRLLYGSLPMVYQPQEIASREADLESYVTAYLEEEVRAEALVRN